MSVPSYTLCCDQCGYAASSNMVMGMRVYRDENGEFPCHATTGWCDDCRELAPIEDFDCLDVELKSMEADCHWIGRSLTWWQSLLNVFLPFRIKSHRRWLENIEASCRILTLGQSRRGDERCLSCGSNRVQPFNGEVKLRMEGYSFRGESKTGFQHPVCGGEFVAKADEMRFMIQLQKKVYSPDGQYIATED